MPHFRTSLFFARAGALILCFCAAAFAIGQSSGNQQSGTGNSANSSQQQPTPPPSVPGAPQPPPKPGDLGWPFPNQHWWNHWAMELGGGYTPIVNKGAGYFDHGYMVTAGAVDHARSDLNLLAEFQFIGLQGSQQYSGSQYSISGFSADAAVSYALFSRARNSPYLVGGGGYYYLSPAALQDNSYRPNLAGFQAGLGFCHHLFLDRNTEWFVECRYHYIENAASYGQLSLLPVTGGIRW